ncbi:MAG: hypothetical protein JRM72_01235 [Nitrososphaerota archaeon]|nr:hypothetical protein [Nitrososphaerota archaeon]
MIVKNTDNFENIKISFWDGIGFETRTECIKPGASLSGRILLAITKKGMFVKDRPASARTCGYQVWSVPSSLATLINMVNYGTPEQTIAQVLSGTLDEVSLRPTQDAIDRALAVLRRLKRKNTVLALQRPEITIRLADWGTAPGNNFSYNPYVITAALKLPIKYLVLMTKADVVRFIETPLSAVRFDINTKDLEAVFVDGVVYTRSDTWGLFQTKQMLKILEIPKGTPRSHLTPEIYDAISKATNKGIPVSAVLALKEQ